MNIDKLREEIEADEGRVNAVYLDHLKLPTCGIGHLIKESDPEYTLEVGTHIDDERINELFDQDISITLNECKSLYNNFERLPEEAQLILANMMFNMGKPRLSKFKKMNTAIAYEDYETASNEMMDSKWYRQVTNRADRLVQRMKNIAS
jgi:lysozyme